MQFQYTCNQTICLFNFFQIGLSLNFLQRSLLPITLLRFVFKYFTNYYNAMCFPPASWSLCQELILIIETEILNVCVLRAWPTLGTVVQCCQSSTVFTALPPKWVSVPVRKLSGEMQHPLLLKQKVPVTLKYCSASATLVGNTLLMKRPNVLVPIHSADSLALKININKLETKQPIWKINHKNN